MKDGGGLIRQPVPIDCFMAVCHMDLLDSLAATWAPQPGPVSDGSMSGAGSSGAEEEKGRSKWRLEALDNPISTYICFSPMNLGPLRNT